ncbi:MAG TPA: galactokinase family protein, partial [Magnetospirillaceae bacterium]|nr:galactokinase family protein [Magnetospirillaceae bacterium]
MGSYPHPRPSTRLLDRLGDIYGKSEAPAQAARYALLTRTAREAFGGEPRLFTAPGRTELGGNHTDHNRGRVLCAAVTLDAAAAAVPADGMSGEIWSDGWPRPFLADFSSPEPVKAERGTTDAILRGVAAGFLEAGLRVGGFKAVVNSNVLPGSGLSSSAALEVLLGTILSGL